MAELSSVGGSQPPVVLAFENGDRALPIIMGVVQETAVDEVEAITKADLIEGLEVVVLIVSG